MPVLYRALTDVGRKRSQNEDSHAVWVAPETPGGGEAEALALVADGMGGAQSGEIASGMVADIVVRRYRDAERTDPAAVLASAFQEANAAVFERSESADEYHGMGTTCTAVALRGRHVWIAHVGDSRAYLVRGGAARRLTRDHSLVAELVRRGELTEEQARIDPRRNVVMRSMGVDASVAVDVVSLDEDLGPGDTVVLSSDGLHGQVADDEIAAAFASGSLQEACSELVRLALDRGGPDNITVIALAVDGEGPAERGTAPVGGAEWERSSGAAPAYGGEAGGADDDGSAGERYVPEEPVWDSGAGYSAVSAGTEPEFRAPPQRGGGGRSFWIVVLVVLVLLAVAVGLGWLVGKSL